tara:strand:- start:5819 stop:6061 length:243 start_codon:yes stop_codon:yes gene_type:complete
MQIEKIEKVSDHTKCSLSIQIYRKRIIDWDNLVGGCKQLIDALCKELYIYDDSDKYLGIPEIEQHKSAGNEFVLIRRELI